MAQKGATDFLGAKRVIFNTKLIAFYNFFKLNLSPKRHFRGDCRQLIARGDVYVSNRNRILSNTLIRLCNEKGFCSICSIQTTEITVQGEYALHV